MTLRITALPKGEIVVFDGLTGFCRHPIDPYRFEFKATFMHAARAAGVATGQFVRREFQVPLIFLTMFYSGSTWIDQSLVPWREAKQKFSMKTGRMSVDPSNRSYAHRFGNEGSWEQSTLTFDETELSLLPPDAKADLIGRGSIGRYAVGWGEFVRFYFCAFQMILPEIIQCAQSAGDLTHLCRDFDYREDERTLYLTPLAHLRDRASILQVAILLADTELRSEVLRIGRMITSDALNMPLGPFLPQFPMGTSDIKVQYYGPSKAPAKGDNAPKRIARMRSDYRPPKFVRIVARIFGPEDVAPELDHDDVSELQTLIRSYAGRELAVGSTSAVDARQLSAPVAWQHFREGLPNYRGVIIDIENRPTRPLSAILLPTTYEPFERIAATSADAVFGIPTVSFRANSRTWLDADPPENELLAAPGIFAMPIEVAINPENLRAPLDTLFKAAAIIGRSSDEEKAALAPRLFLIPETWGSFSTMPDGQPRRFLSFGFRTLSAHAHAIEFGRMSKDIRTSIGVLVKFDGQPMSDLELFTCVRSAVRHISGIARHAQVGIRNHMIWPTSAFYIDVSSRALRHIAAFKDPDRLAAAVRSAGDLLFD